MLKSWTCYCPELSNYLYIGLLLILYDSTKSRAFRLSRIGINFFSSNLGHEYLSTPYRERSPPKMLTIP